MTYRPTEGMGYAAPPFNADGLLPPGTYPVDFAELRASHLVTGSFGIGKTSTWDAAWRARLVDNAEVLGGELWQIGITEIFLDGTFVEAKDRPNDIDGYFEVDVREWATREPERKLNTLNPHKVWTWDPRARRLDPNSLKRQLPMWHVYRVELYPHFGQLCGITDQHGHELPFPSAFRQQRDTYKPEGIVKIVP
ncbi:MAG: DUF6932 family protein [Gemmatimonadota bacterium]